MQYRLERVDRIPKRPAWSNIGGIVAHEIVNAYERQRARGEVAAMTPDRAAEMYRVGLRLKIEEFRETTEFAPELWYAADGGREGQEWWQDKGPEFVALYIERQADRTAETMVDKGTGQLMLEVDLAGIVNGVPVRGIIDHVLEHATGALTVRDFKFGRNAPAPGGIQLPAYGVLLAQNGLLADPDGKAKQVEVWGDYWLGRKGAASRAIRIPLPDAYERFGYEASLMDVSERAGLYPVNPSNLCIACSVRRACPVMGDDDQRRPLVLDGLPNSSLLTLTVGRGSVLDVQPRTPVLATTP